MSRNILAILAVLLSSASAMAQELTLKDFNTPEPETVIREALLEAGVKLEAMSLILVANDDCELGWSDEQLKLIIWNVNFMSTLATPESGETPLAFDVTAMSEQWTEAYSRGNRVAKMTLCDPLKRVSEAAQSKL